MTTEELLRGAFVGLEVNDDFSEAVLCLADGGRLRFCHRVGERWAKAEGPVAEQVLAAVVGFRLNGKHLDIRFTDGSRWEAWFGGGGGRRRPQEGISQPPRGVSEG